MIVAVNRGIIVRSEEKIMDEVDCLRECGSCRALIFDSVVTEMYRLLYSRARRADGAWFDVNTGDGIGGIPSCLEVHTDRVQRYVNPVHRLATSCSMMPVQTLEAYATAQVIPNCSSAHKSKLGSPLSKGVVWIPAAKSSAKQSSMQRAWP